MQINIFFQIPIFDNFAKMIILIDKCLVLSYYAQLSSNLDKNKFFSRFLIFRGLAWTHKAKNQKFAIKKTFFIFTFLPLKVHQKY